MLCMLRCNFSKPALSGFGNGVYLVIRSSSKQGRGGEPRPQLHCHHHSPWPPLQPVQAAMPRSAAHGQSGNIKNCVTHQKNDCMLQQPGS